MLDLFAAPSAPAPAPSSPAEKFQHNDSYVELPAENATPRAARGATPTPKNFSRASGDLPRATNTTKIEPENLKKNTKSKIEIEVSPLPHTEPVRVREGDELAPKPHSAWMERPQWHERRAPPLRRGYRHQAANVESILAQVATPKPDLPDTLADDTPEAIVEHLVAYVEAGGTQTEFTRITGIGTRRIRKMLDTLPGARDRFETARRTTGADAIAEEALRIATEPLMTEESIETYDKDDELVTRSVKRADNVYARKLAYQARMQLLQKWAPERYGENVKPAVGDSMAERLRKARDRLMGEYYGSRRELSLPPGVTEYPSSRWT